MHIHTYMTKELDLNSMENCVCFNLRWVSRAFSQLNHHGLLPASIENDCKYCAAAHITVLKPSLHVPAEVVSAVKSNLPLPDPKSNALVALTRET